MDSLIQLRVRLLHDPDALDKHGFDDAIVSLSCTEPVTAGRAETTYQRLGVVPRRQTSTIECLAHLTKGQVSQLLVPDAVHNLGHCVLDLRLRDLLGGPSPFPRRAHRCAAGQVNRQTADGAIFIIRTKPTSLTNRLNSPATDVEAPSPSHLTRTRSSTYVNEIKNVTHLEVQRCRTGTERQGGRSPSHDSVGTARNE